MFHEAGKPHSMSDTMRWFVGGQQRLMPEWLAMIAPTVNSYRRLIPGFWAPTDATWGVGKPHDCAARDPGQPEIAARRIPNRRRRFEPLRHPGGCARLGTLGHRAQGRARGRGQRECLRPEVPGAPRAAAHAVGCGAAAQVLEGRTGLVRRRFRRALSPRRASGRSGSSASTSATGSWLATSRSSDVQLAPGPTAVVRSAILDAWACSARSHP